LTANPAPASGLEYRPGPAVEHA